MFMVECSVNSDSDMHNKTGAHKNIQCLIQHSVEATETETFHYEKLFMHSHADNKAGNI